MAVQLGAVVLPLTGSTANSVLKDGDPIVHRALGYFSASLSELLGTRWDAEMALTELSGTALVGSCWPYDTSMYVGSSQLKVPSISVYRTETVPEARLNTRGKDAVASRFTVDVVFPPSSAMTMLRVAPFQKLVGDAVFHALTDVSEFACSGAYDVSWSRTSYATFPADTGKTFFPLTRVEFSVQERSTYVTSDLEPLLGIDYDILVPSGSVGSDGTTEYTFDDDGIVVSVSASFT